MRVSQCLMLLSGGIADCAGVEIQQMADEFIRVLRLDSVLPQDIVGKVIKVGGDNDTGLASCRCILPVLGSDWQHRQMVDLVYDRDSQNVTPAWWFTLGQTTRARS